MSPLKYSFAILPQSSCLDFYSHASPKKLSIPVLYADNIIDKNTSLMSYSKKEQIYIHVGPKRRLIDLFTIEHVHGPDPDSLFLYIV